jgi:hypothetical protein
VEVIEAAFVVAWLSISDGCFQETACCRIETVGTGRKAKSRPRATQGYPDNEKMERAMGIEPTRTAPLSL